MSYPDICDHAPGRAGAARPPSEGVDERLNFSGSATLDAQPAGPRRPALLWNPLDVMASRDPGVSSTSVDGIAPAIPALVTSRPRSAGRMYVRCVWPAHDRID